MEINATLKLAMSCICFVLLFGCGSSNGMQHYLKTHESARNSLPLAVQLEQVFGGADHFIVEFNMVEFYKQWQTVAFSPNGYEITLVVDVSVDNLAEKVKKRGKCKVYVNRIERVEIDANGTGAAYYDANREFTEEEWVKLFGDGRDLSKVGIDVNRKAPKGFDLFVKNQRDPRVPVSLLGAKNNR
jgi:hypothetical protein